MKICSAAFCLLAASFLPRAFAGHGLTVTVTHSLASARPAETITVPWGRVAEALPGALIYHLEVRDAAGRVLPYQVTNLAPTLKDATGQGAAYGDLLFQHDFAAGEKSAVFTIEKIEAVAPVFPVRAFARYVPERLDDFAWENDKIAHRIYGPGLAAPAPAGSDKEVLVSSGIDVWCKRVSYPIVDRWYNKGHNFYHKYDLSEGMDMYNVSQSRGCGGTGIWDGHQLAVGSNYHTWKILTNGPVRAVFEVTYDAWAAHGLMVAETKCFTVDAGHNLDQVESTFTVTEGSATELTVAIGLHKAPTDKGQDPRINYTPVPADGSLTQWVVQKTHGSLATAVIVPSDAFRGFAEDDRNRLVLAKVTPGQPLRYCIGAGWSAAGEFTTEQAWIDYVAACVARLRSPITVTLGATP
jgi:pectinesterase